MKNFNAYYLSLLIAPITVFGAILAPRAVIAANFTQGGNARMMSKNHNSSRGLVAENAKKKKKINIDFNKKNPNQGRPSEMSEKISEAEDDLLNASSTAKDSNAKMNSSSKPYHYTSNGSEQKISLSNPPRSIFDSTRSSLKVEAKEPTKVFSLSLMVANSREVEMPESGRYSNETTFILLPSYKLTENYSAGLKLIGVHDYDDSSKSMMKTGNANVVKKALDINEYFTYSPGLVFAFPVNSVQRDRDSFLGATQANITFATKKDLLGKLSLSSVFGATKSFYEYSTQLNLDPEADDTYNSDYSVYEMIQVAHPIIGDLSFSFSIMNKQAWDYIGEKKYSYDMTETLNWEVNSVFTIFGGLENEEAAKVSEADLVYRIFNSETSTYVLGFNIGI